MKVNRNMVLCLMAEKSFTQAALAERAGIARPTVSNVLRVGGNPATIKKIADALGVSVMEIIKED